MMYSRVSESPLKFWSSDHQNLTLNQLIQHGVKSWLLLEAPIQVEEDADTRQLKWREEDSVMSFRRAGMKDSGKSEILLMARS